MSFQDELEPKVAEIDRLAREMYDLYLGVFGLKGGEDGQLVEDPDEFAAVADFSMEEEQEKYAEFLSFLDDVKARFEKYYDLDPLDLTILTYSLGGHGGGAVASPVPSTVHGRIQYADDTWMRPVLEMITEEDWSGGAALTFRDDFVAPFHRAALQQMACTSILAMGAQAFHDAVTSIQDDLLEIADAGIARLSGDYGGGGSGGFFTVVSFIAGAVGLFLPTGASQVAGVISLGSGVASVFAGIDDSDERREWTISGVNAPMILESIWDNLLELDEIIAGKDEQMADGLEQDLDSPTAFSSADLRLPEPTGLDSDGFGDLTVDTVVAGVPISENKVVVSIVSLYEAGYRNLPYAAYQYEQAVAELVEPLPGTLSRHFYRSRLAFQLARARLRVAVSGIRWHLTNSGEALVQIATDYELTDERGAEVLRQIGEIHPPILSDPVGPGGYY
ncbi:MAG: hypothetical protein GEV12_02035 [Micromonosporaceae bacterium]|nr:hypothetical protein [Micromonosporaceae bacterium]